MTDSTGAGAGEVDVANLDALQLVQTARAVATVSTTTGSTDDAPVLTVAPSAAELRAIDPTLVTETSEGTGAVNIATVAGLAWAAAGVAGDQIAALTLRVKALEKQLADLGQ